jgi:hypothetical protein
MTGTSVAACGYQFVPGADMRAALDAIGPLADWAAFADSWNDLRVDPYLAEGARFRRRRFGVYEADAHGGVVRQPHQPHFQHRDYNALFGGVERWFEPITPQIGSGPTLQTIIAFCVRFFGPLAPDAERWRVEAHQFRIEARRNLPGQPTPEGVHRDGVDFVLVLLVARQNIVSGVTTVYDLDGQPLGAFTLTEPFDATLVDDTRVAHGVTPVAPLDPARPGFRDVLVVTLRRTTETTG